MPSSLLLNVKDVSIFPHALLSECTTFKLGGPCLGLISCQTPEQLEGVIFELIAQKTRFILLGGGSNVVVSDHGLDCHAIRYVSERPIIHQEKFDLFVSGSTSLDALAHYAAQAGLEGLNYTTGIPGTVGGAVVGNAGAFGKQVGDVLKSVRLINNQTGIKREVGPEVLDFRYRDSNLKTKGDIVISVRFGLRQGDREALLKEREEILKVRHEKHPNLETEPCAGSFFRNIEPTSKAGKRQATGWFLEQAGGKNLKHGGAIIFSKHANIIIKSNGCTAQDVYELSKMMAKLAKEKFDLDLVREVRFVGKFKDMPDRINEIIW